MSRLIIDSTRRIDTSAKLKFITEKEIKEAKRTPGNCVEDILDAAQLINKDFSGCAKEGDKFDKTKEKDKDRESVGLYADDTDLGRPPILRNFGNLDNEIEVFI